MPKAVSASEAKNTFGSVVGWVLANQDAVIVESHGEPTVVILPFTEYERVQVLKERQRREEALATLRRLRDEVSARNQDLTDDEVDELADRATREAIDNLVRKGAVRFEG
jgi:prevent-host-death family protein